MEGRCPSLESKVCARVGVQSLSRGPLAGCKPSLAHLGGWPRQSARPSLPVYGPVFPSPRAPAQWSAPAGSRVHQEACRASRPGPSARPGPSRAWPTAARWHPAAGAPTPPPPRRKRPATAKDRTDTRLSSAPSPAGERRAKARPGGWADSPGRRRGAGNRPRTRRGWARRPTDTLMRAARRTPPSSSRARGGGGLATPHVQPRPSFSHALRMLRPLPGRSPRKPEVPTLRCGGQEGWFTLSPRAPPSPQSPGPLPS